MWDRWEQEPLAFFKIGQGYPGPLDCPEEETQDNPVQQRTEATVDCVKRMPPSRRQKWRECGQGHPPFYTPPHSWCDLEVKGCRNLKFPCQASVQPAAQGMGQALTTHQVLHADSLQGVVPFGRLSRQHDAVGSVEDSICHITALGSGGAGLLDHALQHLGGTEHWSDMA